MLHVFTTFLHWHHAEGLMLSGLPSFRLWGFEANAPCAFKFDSAMPIKVAQASASASATASVSGILLSRSAFMSPHTGVVMMQCHCLASCLSQ
jgi:hypothetical protein